MSADIFRRRWLGLFALLSGLIFLSPWLIHALVANSGCQGTSGACASLQATLEYHSRWLVLAIVLAPLIVAIAGRTLTAGVFVWAFPFALLMLAGATPLLVALSEIDSADFAAGLLELPALIPLLFLLVLLVALSAGNDEDGGAAGAWKLVLGFAAGAAVFVTAQSWLIGLETLPYAGPAAGPLSVWLAKAHAALGITEQLPRLGNLCLIGFILAGAGMMASARGGGNYKSAYA
ncbi:MAG: hypothetical protein V4574_21335 [Pseudomonadota bacterium]